MAVLLLNLIFGCQRCQRVASLWAVWGLGPMRVSDLTTRTILHSAKFVVDRIALDDETFHPILGI